MLGTQSDYMVHPLTKMGTVSPARLSEPLASAQTLALGMTTQHTSVARPPIRRISTQARVQPMLCEKGPGL